MSRTLFEEYCYGGVQGDRLRVALRYREYGYEGLGPGDKKIFDNGLGTPGEHEEAMRGSFLRIARRSSEGENLTPQEYEGLPEAIRKQLNEGGSKP